MYKALAEVIRNFGNIDLLAQEIESIEEDQQIETIEELTEFLQDELQYACE